MVDLDTVCSMCGDVGFPDKLFRCSKCRYRYQHSYCSNYYSEYSEPIQVCDWCQCEERNSSARHGNIYSRNNTTNEIIGNDNKKSISAHAPKVRSAYSGDKVKQRHHNEGGSSTANTPSPRPGGTRKYKLLKDVMC